jgi:hypothetical protein
VSESTLRRWLHRIVGRLARLAPRLDRVLRAAVRDGQEVVLFDCTLVRTVPRHTDQVDVRKFGCYVRYGTTSAGRPSPAGHLACNCAVTDSASLRCAPASPRVWASPA